MEAVANSVFDYERGLKTIPLNDGVFGGFNLQA